jgi:ribosome-associated protein
LPPRRSVRIHTDTITVGGLLKWAGVTGTGGEAKALIVEGRVRVNGRVETQRGRRVSAGDVVAVNGGPTLAVVKADDAAPAPTLASRVS